MRLRLHDRVRSAKPRRAAARRTRRKRSQCKTPRLFPQQIASPPPRPSGGLAFFRQHSSWSPKRPPQSGGSVELPEPGIPFSIAIETSSAWRIPRRRHESKKQELRSPCRAGPDSFGETPASSSVEFQARPCRPSFPSPAASQTLFLPWRAKAQLPVSEARASV